MVAGDTPWRGRVGARVGAHRLVRPLGGGDDTEVWLADGPFGSVAVKRLRHLRDPTAALRLAREVTALDRLAVEAPDDVAGDSELAWRVPRIVDLGDVPADPWVALEYEAAIPLARLARAGGHRIERLLVLSTLARALVALHRAGIVHRDVKPANVLVGESGVVLLDFAACAVLGTTFDGSIGGVDAVVGTPGYQAPEAGRVDADGALDVFALSVTAHQLLGPEIHTLSESQQLVLGRARSGDPNGRPSMEALAAVFLDAIERSRREDELTRTELARTEPAWSERIAAWERSAPAIPTLPSVSEPIGTVDDSASEELEGIGVLRRHALEATEIMTAVIAAESGWGKTFRLNEAAERAAVDGWLVVRAACDEGHDGIDAIQPWLAQLDLVAPRPGRSALARRVLRLILEGSAAGSGDAIDHRSLDTDELVDVVVELISMCGPTLCVLDDVHHADDVLSEFLGELSGRPASAVVVVAGRPGGPDADDLSAVAIRIPPMDDDAIHSVMGHQLGRAATREEVALVIAASGRQPLLVQEMAAALALGDSTIEGTVAGFAGRRLHRMPSEQRAMAEVFAIGGMGCWPELFGRAATKAAAQLVFDGVLECRLRSQVPGTTELRFVHAAIRDALEASVTADDRCSLHERVGDALIGAAAPAELVAPHAVTAALGGVLRMVPVAIDAAVQAATDSLREFAPARARRHVTDARLVIAELPAEAHPVATEIDRLDRLDLVDAELRLIEGEPTLALQLVRTVSARRATPEFGRVDRLALSAYLELGEYAEVIELGEQLLGSPLVAAGLELQELASIELDLALALTRNGRSADALVVADRAASRLGDAEPVDRAAARTVAALAAAEMAFEGQLLPLDSRRRALEAWQELRDAEPRRWVGRAAELIDAVFWTDWTLGRELAMEAASAAQALGAHSAFAKLACFAADFALEADAPDEAERWLDQIIGSGGWESHAAALRSIAQVGRSPQRIDQSVAELTALARRCDGSADDISLVARVNAAATMLWQGRPQAMSALVETFPEAAALRVRALLGPSIAVVDGPHSPLWPEHATSEWMDPDLPAGPLSYLDRALYRYLSGDRDGGDEAVRSCVNGRRVAGIELPRRVAMANPRYLIWALGPADVDPPLEWFERWFHRAQLPGVWVVHRVLIGLLLAERGVAGFDRETALALLATVPAEPAVRDWIIERASAAGSR